MASLTMLTGRVGKDPTIRTLNSGDKVASFSIATTERWRDKDGERKEATEWHNVVVYGGLAKVVEDWVEKGSLIQVIGQNKTRKWEKNGVDMYTTEVVLSGPRAHLELLGGKGDGGGCSRDDDDDRGSRRSSSGSGSRGGGSRGGGRMGDLMDDEIPFAPEFR